MPRPRRYVPANVEPRETIVSVIVIQFVLGSGRLLFPDGAAPARRSAERAGAAVPARYGRAA